MRKRIAPMVFLAVFCLLLLRPVWVHGAAPDPAQKASLTLTYQKDGQTFSDLPIGIYRVAEALPDGTFGLIEPFASYPVNIHGITIQEQWHTVAGTLDAYIVANQVKPDREAQTDATGTIHFTDLTTGLYFVQEAVAEHTGGTYVFNRFLVYLPTPQPDGSYDYEVEANPKCTDFIPKTQYTVTKLWQDAGMQNIRPKEVTVDIYQDGILQETQILSAANNWSYTWYVSEADRGQWTVTERDVPDEYKVTIRQNGGVFSIINTCPTQPDPPKTGDTFSPVPLVLIMCLCGLLLLILGLYGRRRQW
jgi:LPXTG-motif cell wall-anchored protein